MNDAAGAGGGGGGAVAGAGSSHAANISAAAAVTRIFLSIALSLPQYRCNGSRCFGCPTAPCACIHQPSAKRLPKREYAFEPLDILLGKSRDATSTLRPACFFREVLQICRLCRRNSVLGTEQIGSASGETGHDPG